MLTLAEEFLLLALLEKRETVRLPSSLCLPFALAGAVLMDLMLSDSIKIIDGKVVPLVQPEALADESSQYAIKKIWQAEKYKKLDNWIYIFGAKWKRMPKGIVNGLIDKGVLLEEGKYYCWPPAAVGPQNEMAISKYLLKHQIREAILRKNKADEHFLALLALIESCNTLEHIFTSDEIISARRKIKDQINDESIRLHFLETRDLIMTAIEYAVAAAVTT